MNKEKIKEVYGDINFVIGYLKQWKKIAEEEGEKTYLGDIIKRLENASEKLKKVI